MKTITNISQLIKNLETLENCLVSGEDKLFKEAISLVKHGICFVAYNVNNETRFAPSRFVGYIDNEIEIHLKSPKHGNTTNKAIIDILKSEPHSEKNLESKYIQYCHSLGIKPNKTGALGNERRYWNISLETNSCASEIVEFPEGGLVERRHKHRERNSKVIEFAKSNFKKEHGHLYCQICGFDFEKKYGEIGKDFIEGHHTIPVCEMEISHKTKVDDIVLLCSNCHKMIHRRRPWLKMADLSLLLK